MRVLHVNAGNLYGGIETLLVTLARHRGLCPEMEPEFALCFAGRLSDELRSAGVAVHDLGPMRMSRPWTLWRVRRQLRSLLAQRDFDVVVTHGCWPHIIAAPESRRAGIPVVFWLHEFQTGRHWIERWAQWFRPAFVLANSRATLGLLHHLFADVPAEVLYLPVEPPRIDRASARRDVRAELATPENARVVVTACRLEPWKGHAVLLDALARLTDLTNWQCWIAGGAQRPHEQQYLDALRARVDQLGLPDRVHFLGQRTDVPRLLAAADLYCQPNTGAEPFGLVYVEALYAGLPVVASALGGALEIVDASCGRLVPPSDPAALADALRALLENDALSQQLGAGGPPRAEQLCAAPRQLAELGRLLAGVGNAPLNLGWRTRLRRARLLKEPRTQ